MDKLIRDRVQLLQCLLKLASLWDFLVSFLFGSPLPTPTLSCPQFPCLNFPAVVSQNAVGLLGESLNSSSALEA